MTQVSTMPNVTNPAPAAPAVPDATNATGGKKRGPRRPDQTKVFPTKEAALAEKQADGLRRYAVTAPDGQETFLHAREPRTALANVAMTRGWKIINLDGGAPFGRTAQSIEQRLEALTADERAALLAKYIPGYKPDGAAAAPVAPSPARTTVAATAPAAPNTAGAANRKR